jgi:deoxyribonuclease V
MIAPKPLHDWSVEFTAAVSLQRHLAPLLRQERLDLQRIGTVAGFDVSAAKGSSLVHAAVVILDFATLEVVTSAAVTRAANFPYIPGLLSFREGPAVLAALEACDIVPDLLLFDGQGYAHPRRLGLAAHLGLWLDLPSVGCGKSRLIGEFVPPETRRGAWSPLIDRDETIGAALVTRPGIQPVYVSRGHRCDLASAIEIVLHLSPRYRLCEPIRLAHALCNRQRRESGDGR